MYLCSRPVGPYGPREASFKDAGGRSIEQGNRHPTGHQGAHGQGARSQADAQGWSGESGRTHSACHYALAGFPPALKVWPTHLNLSERSIPTNVIAAPSTPANRSDLTTGA